MARSKRRVRKKAEEIGVSAPKKLKKSKEGSDEGEATVFDQLVGASGIYLKTSSQDEIGVDIPIFQKRLIEAVKSHPNYPKVIDEFVESLQERCESPERFRLSLLPILVAEDSEGSIHGHNQESLMRILLGIDILQPAIANMLLEKLPELMDGESGHGSNSGESNMARLIMNQFRWLDRIVKSGVLTEKMLEMVTIASPDVQHEIITCLPEVVDDAEHIEVARQLREILLQNTSLTVPILDALSNLNLRQELLAEVRVSVLQMLPSAKLEDLPVVTKFILQSVSDNDAFEVICELRSNLDFNSLTPQCSSTPLNPKQSSKSISENTEKSGELLTLDSIRSGIRFQKSVADGWLKAIDSINSSASQKVVDLFVLLILHSTGNRKKNVESLFRNKIKNAHFTEELLTAAFNSHPQILCEYFSNILCLGEVLLRSPDSAVCSYACAIYRLSFVAFDLYCQQEIVGALVTHIGSGFAGEADASLDVLSDLVSTHPKVMAPFAVFIKGILDYLDNLTLSQIRKVFSMLSTLAFSSPREGAMIQDDVHIVIRKQLSSDCPKFKRIGIIGAVMIVRSMARNRQGDESETLATASQFHSSMSNDLYKQIVNLLDMVRSSVTKVPETAALFYDELTRVIEQQDVNFQVKNWISETVVSDFQDDFLVDREAPLPVKSVPIEHAYGLDEAEEGSIAVNILPLLLAANSLNKDKQQSQSSTTPSLVCLASHFRLLRICEQSQQNENLEGIDALLGCPLVIFKADMLDKLDTLAQADREVICAALFYAVNWFIEVINGFSTQSDAEMLGKTLTRLNDVTCLYKQIERALAATPTFQPSLASFDCDSAVPLRTQPTIKGKRPRQQSKRNESKKLDDSVDKAIDKENEKDLDISCVSTAEKEKRVKQDQAMSISMSQCRPYLRELDLRVFHLLKCGFVSRVVLDSDMNTEETIILRIQAPHLYFLLDDLSRKLDHMLSASASSRSSFLKARHDKQTGFSNLSKNSAKDIAEFMVDLLPVLCEHLESTSAFFQTLLASNDGIIDGPGSNTEEASTMTQCYRLLFSCFLTLFSWSGFLGSTNVELFKKALTVLSSRTKLSSTTQSGLQDLLKQAFHYLEQFSATITDMATALTLTKLLVALSGRAANKDINTAIADLTGRFLKREWIKTNGEKESGSKYNEALQYLLRFYLSFAVDPMESLEEISAGAFTEIIDDDNNNVSTSFPTLTRATVPSFYRGILEELIAYLKLTQHTPIKRSEMDQVKERLTQLNIIVREFHIVISLVKAFEQRQVLISALKFGRVFVETFLKLGMPVLDLMLRSEKDTVHSLLKNLQQSTRCLQHFCSHTKVVKDIALTNHVPAVKKTLELFVFRVKAMLALNQCHEAFWMGNLKNRDIQGQEILSQQSTKDDDNDDKDGDADESMEVEKDEEDDEDEAETAEADSVVSHDSGNEDNEEEDSSSETF